MTAEERVARRDRRNFFGSLLAAIGIVVLLGGVALAVSGLLTDIGVQKILGIVLFVVGQVLTRVGFRIRGPRY